MCFRECYTSLGCGNKTGVVPILVILIRSAPSMESCRRDLSNAMAENWPILKTNQNTYYTRSFSPKTCI